MPQKNYEAKISIYRGNFQNSYTFAPLPPYLFTMLTRFRYTAVLEGWSFILLLFIAMPVKYLLGWPNLVQYIGLAHGMLFIAYSFFWLQCVIQYNWKLKFAAWAILASLIPFGTFILDKELKKKS
jgi:integral membrane protein